MVLFRAPWLGPEHVRGDVKEEMICGRIGAATLIVDERLAWLLYLSEGKQEVFEMLLQRLDR
jgi:hypothetical protein